MNIKKIQPTIVICLIIIGLSMGSGFTQTNPPDIKVSLATTKLSYLLDDPNTPGPYPEKIEMHLSLKNTGFADIIISKGFSVRPFHLLLTFIDPDGKGIIANELETALSGDPPPLPFLPVNIQGTIQLLQVEPVEILPDGHPGGLSNDPNPWTIHITIPDVHAYYTLTKAGRYSVKAIIPMRTYLSIDHTVSGVDYSEINRFQWQGVLESNPVEFNLLADADGDGYYYPEPYGQHAEPDCDDSNPDINPGVAEILGNGIDDDCNPVTSDGVVTRVTVLNPNGGNVIPSRTTYNIQWAEPPETVKFDLKYSMNNGTSWTTIANKVTGRSYNWPVPAPANNKNKCLVKVIGYDAAGMKVGEDGSDRTFTIEVVKLTSLNGGEYLRTGTTHTIIWQTNVTIRPVAKTELYYTMNGYLWTILAKLSDNPGSLPWKVPYARSTKCKIKVVLKDSAGITVGSDVSDNFFTIQP